MVLSAFQNTKVWGANYLPLLHPVGYSYFSMLRNKLHWNERTS
jgi:hypothetical protein